MESRLPTNSSAPTSTVFCLSAEALLTLVGHSDTIFGQMNIDNAPGLQHQLPHQAIRNPLIKISNINGGFFILLPAQIQSEIGSMEVYSYQCLAPDILMAGIFKGDGYEEEGCMTLIRYHRVFR